MSAERDRDELLERLLLGELDPSSDEARSFFADDPNAQRELDELRVLEEALEARGEARTRDVVEAGNVEGAVGEELVGDVLRGHANASQSAKRSTPRLVWVAAAAALVLVTLWLRGRPTNDVAETPGELTLGGTEDGLFLEAPVGSVDSIERFVWRAELDPGGWFEVWVFDPDLPLDADPIVESESLTEPAWTPGEPEGGWPRRIRWEVFVYDSAGELTLNDAREATID